MRVFTGIPDTRTDAQKEAHHLMEVGIERYFRNVAETTREVVDFWYANGPGNLTGDKPSGMDKLQAMGTEAQKFWMLAVGRYTMIATFRAIYAATSPEIANVDMAKLDAPYTMAFNPDGSVDVDNCVLKIAEE